MHAITVEVDHRFHYSYLDGEEMRIKEVPGKVFLHIYYDAYKAAQDDADFNATLIGIKDRIESLKVFSPTTVSELSNKR